MNTLKMKTVGIMCCLVLTCMPVVPFIGSTSAKAETSNIIERTETISELEVRLLSAFPDTTDVFMMLRDGENLVPQLKALANSSVFTESGLQDQLTSNPGLMQARMMLFGIAAAANTDTWSAVGSILGNRFAVGVDFGGSGEPQFMILSASKDTSVRDRVMQQLLTLATGGNGSNIKPNQIVPIGELFYQHTSDGLIAVSTHRSMLKNTTSNTNVNSTDQLELFLAKHVPNDAAIWIQVSDHFIDRALADKIGFTKKPTDLLQGYIFGDWFHALSNASDGIVWLTFNDNALTLSTIIDSNNKLPATHQGLLGTMSSEQTVWSAQTIEGYAGQLVISRDWVELFSERESLLSAVGASQAVDFTSTLTAIMGGLDVMDELLPAINGPINLIVARQNYSSLGFTPNPQLPAFALITPIDMTVTNNLGKRLRSGTLSALSIFSMEMANNNQPVYNISMGKHRDVEMVWTEYIDSDLSSSEPSMSMAGPQFNFAPCTAIVNDHFVISTSIDLMNDLIDLSMDNKAPLHVSPNANGAFLLESAGLATILQDNREVMIANNMLEKNHSREEATQNIDLIFALLDLTKDLTITSTPTEHGGVQATIELRFQDNIVAVQ